MTAVIVIPIQETQFVVAVRPEARGRWDDEAQAVRAAFPAITTFTVNEQVGWGKFPVGTDEPVTVEMSEEEFARTFQMTNFRRVTIISNGFCKVWFASGEWVTATVEV